MKVRVPLATFFCIFGVGLYLVYMLTFEFQEYAQRAFWILIIFYLLAVIVRTVREYVNRKMDFLIITPKEVIKYDQSGLLDRDAETIHVDKIKSVTV